MLLPKKMPRPLGRIVAGGMLREGTPVECYPEYRLWVKREDRACLPPGPPFSKTRGVYAHIAARKERLIGVLDTRHSQVGHAVATVCHVLKRRCVNFYPALKDNPGPHNPQMRARELGATLYPLQAGRSAILFHRARKIIEADGGYMMPNGLKLDESVNETAREVPPDICRYSWVIVSASSGTTAAGVVKGAYAPANSHGFISPPRFAIHLGYSRSHNEVTRYIRDRSGVFGVALEVIDEGYKYKDVAREGITPPFPCDPYYDLKAFRWWIDQGMESDYYPGDVLFWNIG
jgi:hypothetical protein